MERTKHSNNGKVYGAYTDNVLRIPDSFLFTEDLTPEYKWFLCIVQLGAEKIMEVSKNDPTFEDNFPTLIKILQEKGYLQAVFVEDEENTEQALVVLDPVFTPFSFKHNIETMKQNLIEEGYTIYEE